MKKIGILNQPLSAVMAGLGHTDTLVIAAPVLGGVSLTDMRQGKHSFGCACTPVFGCTQVA